MMALLYVGVGGAVGSVARYLAMSVIGRLVPSQFPYGTLAVNVLGSFIMGVWIAAMANTLPERGRDLHLLFAVGVLGGFTTFSTFSLDVFYLAERGDYAQALIYISGSVIVSIAALAAGVFLVRQVV